MSETSKDNLKDFLKTYSEEDIEKIRENKIQLVTVEEFQSVYRMQEKQRELIKLEREEDSGKREISILDILQIIVLGVLSILCVMYLLKDYIHLHLIH